MLQHCTDPTVFINLQNICDNFALLEKEAKEICPDDGLWPSAIPVIKSDAYGHGLVETGAALLQSASPAKALAVGSVDEALALRNGLLGKGLKPVPILALLGAYTEEEANACAAFGITPVAQGAEQLPLLDKAALKYAAAPMGIALKLDTGMCRLGQKGVLGADFLNVLKDSKGLEPQLLLSHLAVADTPSEDEFTRGQLAMYLTELAALRRVWPKVRASLFNSAGLMSRALFSTDLRAAFGPHMSRPGMAIYGVSPLHKTTRHDAGAGLKVAMSVAAPVMAVHNIAKGQTISYGRTFKAEKDLRVAVIRAGYADGFSRGLSSKGELCLHGRRVPVLGRVCMQMHMVDIGGLPEVKPGDLAWIMGGEGPNAITPDDLAEKWGTIPYEVCCILGHSNRRIYA